MFTVVIQGPTSDKLLEIIDSYRTSYITEIIYSGWEDDLEVNFPKDIIVIKNKKPRLAGGGNVNYQLQTSKSGIRKATNKHVLKVRSDLIIKESYLRLLEDYYKKYKKILTLSVSPNYAFFTWDFLYFGTKQELQLLFNAPFDNNPNYFPDLLKAVIPETYITAHYLSNFNNEIKHCCNNQEQCLLLRSPGYANSKYLTGAVMGKYFRPLPVIELLWTKYYNNFVNTKVVMEKFGRHDDIFSLDW